jgi:hypothetical protein
MSYVEHCKKHGQHHGEICGECFEDLKALEKAYYEQEEELNATMMAFNILKKENEQLRAMLTSIKQSLIEISIQSEGTVMAIDEMETNKVL